MRNFKSFALIAALALSTAASAVSSTNSDFGHADSSVTASGTYATAVSFSLPAASLTIPSQQIRPGATFTVTIPVTNTTDRVIDISAGTVANPGNATVVNTATDFTSVAVGGTVNMVFTITFSADNGVYSSFSGAANFSFQVLAADAATTVSNLTLQ